jgi:hypothetical protein
MVFEITYRRKDANTSRPKQSYFLEKETQPDRKELVELLNRLTPGVYQEETIEVQICGTFDTQVLRNLGIPIYRLPAVRGEDQPPIYNH